MIAERVREQSAARPQAVAVTFRTGDRLRRWTYRELERNMTRCAVGLEEVDAPGHAVGIVMAPTGNAVAALLAAELRGYPAVLIPSNLGPDETSSVLRTCCVSMVFVPEGERAGATLGGHPRRVPLRREEASESSGWLRLQHGPDQRLDSRSAQLWTDAFIGQLTSGSMGASRLAIRTGAGVLAEIDAVSNRLELDPTDTILTSSSIAHSYALIGGVLAPLLRGAHIALAANASDACDVGEAVPATVVFGLASTYQEFVARANAHAIIGRTRAALSAGAPLPSGLFATFYERCGIPIRQDYGTTETGTIAIDTPGPAVPSTVGRPLTHVELRMVAPDRIPLEPDEDGEIQVRSVAVARGYAGRDGFEPCVDEEGWYRTKDAGTLDETGRLTVGRRLRDPIVVQGVPVRLDVVERAIEELPGVREVAVVGIRDRAGKPALKALVVAPTLDLDVLSRWCRTRLPPSHEPARIELRDELPHSPAGKLLQKYLIES